MASKAKTSDTAADEPIVDTGAKSVAESAPEPKKSKTKKTTGVRQSRQTKKASQTASQPHSGRYAKIAEKIEVDKRYPLSDAIALAKATSTTKFDGSIELHLHLTAKRGKKGVEDEYARGVLALPQGLGKKIAVAILDEAAIEKIAATQKMDFDVAIATPALMPKLGKVAKILGPKGKMPNPKIGTVTTDPEKVKAEIEAGRVEYRQDKNHNVHQMIGKASWDVAKLTENAQAVLKVFPTNRLASATVASTMGPGVKIALDK